MTNLEEVRARPAVSLEAAIVARRYFIEDKQKSEIADELGISRFKVARLLDEARSSGIVRIYVDMPADIDLHVGAELVSTFSIGRAIVVKTSDSATDTEGYVIGAAAAEYLRGRLTPADLVGISWGTSLTNVIDAIISIPPVDVVQLVGGMHAGELDVSGLELVRRMSQKSGGRAYPLYAPLLVGTAQMAADLRHDPSLADVIGRFDRLTIALVGIGSWIPPKSSLFNELGPAERSSLLAQGAAADVCTVVFDHGGRVLESDALARAIGITLPELRQVPEVIAVAGGPAKVDAIASVLRSGVVNTLVTDSTTAAQLLAG